MQPTIMIDTVKTDPHLPAQSQLYQRMHHILDCLIQLQNVEKLLQLNTVQETPLKDGCRAA